MLYAVIMAGGAGTRFWPASRSAVPKQLLDLSGQGTMIQSTVARLGELVPPERVLVVTNQRLVDPIREQLPQLPPESVIGEPCKRDTAPCVGLAAGLVSRDDPDATMIVMPADHVIAPDSIFQEAICQAAELVAEKPARLVTFGIKPSYASESFGYIERGSVVTPSSGGGRSMGGVYQVKQFREKPSAEVAKQYLDSGGFYWNSGIFVWQAATITDQLTRHEPEMQSHLQNIVSAAGSDRFDEVLASEFPKIDGTSIDYAVMERARDVVVIEAPFRWDDVGSWQALSRLRGSDDEGNTVDARHLGIDTRGTIVRGPKDHLIVTLGLEDCIVVHTEDATLVARKEDEESVREVVRLLEQRGWNEHL